MPSLDKLQGAIEEEHRWFSLSSEILLLASFLGSNGWLCYIPRPSENINSENTDTTKIFQLRSLFT